MEQVTQGERGAAFRNLFSDGTRFEFNFEDLHLQEGEIFDREQQAPGFWRVKFEYNMT